MQLRAYQREAVDRVYAHLRERDDNPCVVIPTGGGKTPVIATICRDAVELWKGVEVVRLRGPLVGCEVYYLEVDGQARVAADVGQLEGGRRHPSMKMQPERKVT